MARILVIDDEPELVRFVQRALEADGHEVTAAGGGPEGLSIAFRDHPDLIVLDLMMPDVDGRHVLQSLRAAAPDIRVLILSAESHVGARVELLEAGAVDFMAKPFSVRELLARVQARLVGVEERAPAGGVVLRVGRVTLDVLSRSVQIDGRVESLTQREFLLLRCLMRQQGRVCSREELLADVWGYGFDPTTNVVDVCVRRLRQKLRGDLIRTVRNVGYQLQAS